MVQARDIAAIAGETVEALVALKRSARLQSQNTTPVKSPAKSPVKLASKMQARTPGKSPWKRSSRRQVFVSKDQLQVVYSADK